MKPLSNKGKKNLPLISDSAMALKKQGTGKIPSDILGSYTGTPKDYAGAPAREETPEQDNDDI